MKKVSSIELVIVFLTACVIAVFVNRAYATTPPKPTQEQSQESISAATANSESVSAASANNEGNALSVNTEYERSAPDVILVPNNNTESCLRVFGFGGSRSDGSAIFGVPFRSKACDFDKAGDDAAATGDHATAWFWRCHKKSLYTPFRGKDESRASAIADCHAQMIGAADSQAAIGALSQDVAFLQNELAIQREDCDKSKNRIIEAATESTERAIDACHSK